MIAILVTRTTSIRRISTQSLPRNQGWLIPVMAITAARSAYLARRHIGCDSVMTGVQGNTVFYCIRRISIPSLRRLLGDEYSSMLTRKNMLT